MRGLTQSMYSATLRMQALAGLGCVAWLISEVPAAIARDQYIGLPLALAVIAGVISLATLWPFLTPSWIGGPTRAAHFVPLVLAHLMLPLLYGFVAMNAVVAADLPQSISQQVGVGIALGLLLASALCLCLGAFLCFWSRKALSRGEDADFAATEILHELPPDRITPELELARPRQADGPQDPAPEPDFGKLRRARLQRAS